MKGKKNSLELKQKGRGIFFPLKGKQHRAVRLYTAVQIRFIIYCSCNLKAQSKMKKKAHLWPVSLHLHILFIKELFVLLISEKTVGHLGF